MRRWLAVAPLLFCATIAVAQNAPLPTPESHFGHAVGADYKLIDYEASIAYITKLAAASPRMKLVNVGKTSFGRPWTLVLISSPANLANLDRLQAINQRLAHPAGLTDDAARALAREGKAFVDISGGLHASEIAGSQHTIQLAYDLASKNDPATLAMLENDVLMLWPSINPDGQDIVAHWYQENVGTPFETAPLHELYQKYIGHDNNRDAYMLNVIESRVVARTWREWEPQIIYVQHQTAPFPTRIWLPPFAEPIAPRVAGLMSREVNTIGMTIAQQLETEGKVGSTHMGTGFDAWYPGYIDYMPMLQNIAAFWTETALYQYATPHFYTIRDFPRDYQDLRPQSLYASPWQGGWWRLRDAVDYMRTASVAVLDYANKYKEQLLWNRYQAGRNAIAKYAANPPYVYFVPQSQRDPGAAVELLRRMAFNGVRVEQLDRDVTYDGVKYARGTWAIPMDQEYAELVRQLFEPQEYPDLRETPDGPPEPPYDAAGWTLPYQMDVRVVEGRVKLSDDVRSAMKPVRGKAIDWRTVADAPFASDATAAGIIVPPTKISGVGDAVALDPAQNDAFRVIHAALAAGGTVKYDGGKYLVSGVPAAKMDEWVAEYGLRAERKATSGVKAQPRIALFKPWTASMDEGWTEWMFDTYGFKYTTITNADVQAGDLGARFDVIMIASESARTITDGFGKGTVPPKYEGGIGDQGTRALDAFVRAGGTLITMNQSSTFAIDAFKLPVQNVTARLQSKDFFASGSILEVIVDPTHPVMAGMPERAKIFYDRSPAFTTLEGFSGRALAKYAPAGSPKVSGYLLGEKYLQGMAAALDVQHGKGRVILIGFRPQWRGQPFGTFRVVFNAALFGRETASVTPLASTFWQAPKVAAPAGDAPRGRTP
jgi:hypothetical protein